MDAAGGDCAIRSIRLIICEPCRLIYRPLPKCASTTMYGLLARLGGNAGRTDGNPHRALPLVRRCAGPGRGGSYEVLCSGEEAGAVLKGYGGYTVFSVVRNPFDRVASNYHNKLNRFARRFCATTYFGGYVGPFLAGGALLGPPGRIRWMQRRISFDRFVEVLTSRGIAWDIHFDLQVRLLGTDVIRYDRLIPLESLSIGLETLLADRAPAGSGVRLAEEPGRLNASAGRSAAGLWSEATRAAVARLYADDFDQLGYPLTPQRTPGEAAITAQRTPGEAAISAQRTPGEAAGHPTRRAA